MVLFEIFFLFGCFLLRVLEVWGFGGGRVVWFVFLMCLFLSQSPV